MTSRERDAAVVVLVLTGFVLGIILVRALYTYWMGVPFEFSPLQLVTPTVGGQ